MRLSDITRTALATLSIPLLSATAGAQWLNYPTPGVPRLPDGKPNLSAPAPKTLDGKPDLTGIWSGASPTGASCRRIQTRHGSAIRSADGKVTRWSSRRRGSTIKVGSIAPDILRPNRCA